MDKLTLSRITAFAGTERLRALAETVAAGREALFLKKPEKTMVLLRIREPARQSLFYLGEMLAVHCVVELAGARGAAVLMGDDFSKAEAAAILDAAHTGGFGEFALVEPELLRLEEDRLRELAAESAAVQGTRVRFQALEDREV